MSLFFVSLWRYDLEIMTSCIYIIDFAFSLKDVSQLWLSRADVNLHVRNVGKIVCDACGKVSAVRQQFPQSAIHQRVLKNTVWQECWDPNVSCHPIMSFFMPRAHCFFLSNHIWHWFGDVSLCTPCVDEHFVWLVSCCNNASSSRWVLQGPFFDSLFQGRGVIPSVGQCTLGQKVTQVPCCATCLKRLPQLNWKSHQWSYTGAVVFYLT